MCLPKGIRCPPSNKSISPYYCICFKEDSGFTWLAFCLSQKSMLSLVILVEICLDSRCAATCFSKTSGKAVNNDITSFFMKHDPEEHVFSSKSFWTSTAWENMTAVRQTSAADGAVLQNTIIIIKNNITNIYKYSLLPSPIKIFVLSEFTVCSASFVQWLKVAWGKIICSLIN